MKRTRRNWTKEEEQYIFEHIKEHGLYRGLVKHLQITLSRSISSVRAKLKEMEEKGVIPSSQILSSVWSKKDEQTLLQYIQKNGLYKGMAKDIQKELFPNRNTESIRRKIRQMIDDGIISDDFMDKPWTTKEINLLKEYDQKGFVRGDMKQIAKRLGRTENAVRHMVCKLRKNGVLFCGSNRFTEEEKQYMIQVAKERGLNRETYRYLEMKLNHERPKIARTLKRYQKMGWL
jgi:hypothetical protein